MVSFKLAQIIKLSVVAALALAPVAAANPVTRPTILGYNGMVSVGHYLAAHTGNKILVNGGNAIDAGAAMLLSQSVLEYSHMGFGGEAPLLIYVEEDEKVYFIDGNTASAKAADVAWFQDKGIAAIPGDGNLAGGVPSTPAAVIKALELFGTISFAEAAEDAIRLAGEGYPLDPTIRNHISRNADKYRTLPEYQGSYDMFLAPYGGEVPEIGDRLVMTDLARTLQTMADAEQAALAAGGTRLDGLQAAHDAFYKGEIAQIFIDFVANTPVLDATGSQWTSPLTLEDMATYEAFVREPWSVTYTAGDGTEYVVYKGDTSNQGPVFLQQLQMLKQFDLQELGYGTADYWHVIIEVMKLAFADRGQWYGDPMFVDVPKDGLLSEQYAIDRLAEHFRMDRALNENIPGDPWKYEGRTAPANPRLTDGSLRSPELASLAGITDPEAYWAEHGGSTSSTRAVDKAGNMFSSTPSGGWYHSNPVIPGLGFVLNSRIQMFRVDVDNHAKSYIGGARPSSSLTPTLVTKDGKAFMGFGTAGGDAQDMFTVQTFLNYVEFGFRLQEAIDQPKAQTWNSPGLFYPFASTPGRVRVNSAPFGVDQAVFDELAARGHLIEYAGLGFNTATAAVVYHADTGLMEGAASAARDKQWTIGW